MSKSTKKIGLITAPGYPKELGEKLNKQLPDLLSYYVEDRYDWDVKYMVDPLTGATEESSEVLRATLEKKSEEGWDFAVCMTDLPLFKGKRPIIAEAYEEGNVALISLPGLGSTPMFKRVRESILQLVNEMYYGSSEKDRKQAEERIQSKDNKHEDELKNKNSKRLIGKRGVDILSRIQRETPDDDESNIDVRFTVKSQISGALRLLTGMVRANRPWAMFPAFMKVIIIAFTTGAYALVFPTLWMLSDNYGVWRMFMLSISSILAMVGWIILAHKLWEKPNENRADYLRKLYNTATILTLLVTVTLYYFLLFLLFSVAVIAIIPMGMLESQLSGDVGYINYFYIAWTATSVSTIIGALGSALEKEEVVLSSTYGYRQQQRYKQIKEAEEEERNKQGNNGDREGTQILEKIK
ncbi:hypothetical protein [Halobacillus karajensis]|uniref:5,10-methylene-tetrahydrofolate dehydrogenase n=1 Tax=Halobacillus karajensis TaxID=195088 RepID=A0A024P689_9BACI|nr:hypothetical protein [Halobacillus karajensis]CDQ20663.1 hypothetical protein BN982_03016 [Halobacillus karajensis]CDQ23867.1 hypothetical protein BN983_02120 [Halobacillus karajensis]CDQ27345.1 hypothetical protein BN981_01601 [Halobacillus karajensis]